MGVKTAVAVFFTRPAYPKWLLGIFTVWFGLWAIRPPHPQDFILEHILLMSFSMLYELMEWGVAMLVAGDVGQSYLGTQGDEWDAHKDMALATLGGLIAITITMLVNWRFHRDFAVEFAASLTPDHPAPQGSGDA
jgi:uncharacterized membrane protein YjdF